MLMTACGFASREKQTTAMPTEEKYYQSKTAFFYSKWGASILANKYSYRPTLTSPDSVVFLPLYYSPELLVSSETLYSYTVPMGEQYKLPMGKSMLYIDAGTFFGITPITNYSYLQVNGEVYIQTDFQEKIQVNAGDCSIWCESGSELNINNYADEPYSSISLVKGSCTITRCGTKTTINEPGREIILHRSNGKIEERTIVPSEISAWIEGRQRSQQVSLTCQLRQLSRWFNKTINYRGDLLTEAKQHSFNYRENSLSGILSFYHLAHPNYWFSQVGQSIYVSKRK